MYIRGILAYVFVTLLGGVAAAQAPDTLKPSLSSCALPILVLDDGLKDVKLDGKWERFGHGVVACRASGRKDRWIVDYVWFLVPSKPGIPFTKEQVESLSVVKEVTEETPLQLATFRTSVKAKSVDDVRRVAFARRPRVPPKEMLEIIEAQYREE